MNSLRLDDIEKRWKRMQRWHYDLGRINSLEDVKVWEPLLVVYSNKPSPVAGTKMCAIIGPLSDPETLEDAIAYQEAPNDIQYLLETIKLLQQENKLLDEENRYFWQSEDER